MLPKQYRITHDQFWNNPRRQTKFQQHFFIALIKLSDTGSMRFCIQVARAVDKRATGRNRLKRLITEDLRPNLDRAISKDVTIKVIRKVEDLQRGILKKDVEILINQLSKI